MYYCTAQVQGAARDHRCDRKESAQPSAAGSHAQGQRLYLVMTSSVVVTDTKLTVHLQQQVKLSANAKFGFLGPSHGFHAYYAYLRDDNPPLRVTSVVKANGGSLLLDAEYSDDVSGSSLCSPDTFISHSPKRLLHVFHRVMMRLKKTRRHLNWKSRPRKKHQKRNQLMSTRRRRRCG